MFEERFLVVPNDLLVRYEGSLEYLLPGQELGPVNNSVASASSYARLLREDLEQNSNVCLLKALIALVLKSFLLPSATHGRLNRLLANLRGAVYLSRLSIKLSLVKEILRSPLCLETRRVRVSDRNLSLMQFCISTLLFLSEKARCGYLDILCVGYFSSTSKL